VITLLAAVTVGLITGRVLGILMNRRDKRAAPKVAAKPRVGSLGAGGADERLRGLPCTVGDVVTLAHGEEAWLSGAILFRERVAHRDEAGDPVRTAAALFVGPDRAVARAVYARPLPEASLDWMWPLAPDALTIGTEPPSAVEHDGERFERVRRIPLALVVVGTGAPELGSSAVVGEYEGAAGARLLVVIGVKGTTIWRGRRLEEGMYDVLPGTQTAGS